MLASDLSNDELKASARALIEQVKAEAAELVGEARREEADREDAVAEHKEDNKRFVQSVLDMIHMDNARSAPVVTDAEAKAASRKGKGKGKGKGKPLSSAPSPYKVKSTIAVGGGAKIRGVGRGSRKRGRTVGGASATLSIDDLKKVIKKEPANAGLAALRIAKLYAKQQRGPEALRYFEKCRKLQLKHTAMLKAEQAEAIAAGEKAKTISRSGSARPRKETRKEAQKREAFERKWAAKFAEATRVVVESHHAMWRLLLEVPTAAAALNEDAHVHGFRIDEGVAHRVTADNTQVGLALSLSLSLPPSLSLSLSLSPSFPLSLSYISMEPWTLPLYLYEHL